MSKYIHPITVEAALDVASNLLPDDRREVEEGHGHDPVVAIPACSKYGDTVYFTVPNGELAGVAGVQEDGRIWMLCTPAIHKYPLTFAREAKRYVESRQEKLLCNIVDKLNRVHIKLLRFLGFKFLRGIKTRTNNLPLWSFAVCLGAQARAQNEAARRQYNAAVENRKRNWMQQLSVQNLKNVQYEVNMDRSSIAMASVQSELQKKKYKIEEMLN